MIVVRCRRLTVRLPRMILTGVSISFRAYDAEVVGKAQLMDETARQSAIRNNMRIRVEA